jgi:hypothetical protein
MVPTRFIGSASDTRSARLARFLTRGDPMADAVIDSLSELPHREQEALIARMLGQTPGQLPHALGQLREWLHETPLWFDEERSNAGGRVLLKAGLLSGLVLGFKSLILGYCSPGGNKPLVFSGRLADDEQVSRRLAETARFVEAVSHANGLRFGSPGFRATVRVRLIHARVRHALKRSAQWQTAAWGTPINQYDMAGTVLLFSSQLVGGLRQLGAAVSEAQEADTLHSWRFIGRLMGVDEELVSTSPHEARALWSMLEASQRLPDLDSRRLSYALIHSGSQRGAPEAAADFASALCRELIGPRYADALELPRNAWGLAPALLRQITKRMGSVVSRLPGGSDQLLRVGTAYWRRTVEMTFGQTEVGFELPVEPIGDASNR